jgi:hypothetical protein
LNLDPGTYEIEVVPRDGSSYPRWAVEDVTVGVTPVSLDVHLPAASKMSGGVTDPQGKPAAQTDVAVYLIDGPNARLRGQARTAPDGSFSLILANPSE